MTCTRSIQLVISRVMAAAACCSLFCACVRSLNGRNEPPPDASVSSQDSGSVDAARQDGGAFVGAIFDNATLTNGAITLRPWTEPERMLSSGAEEATNFELRDNVLLLGFDGAEATLAAGKASFESPLGAVSVTVVNPDGAGVARVPGQLGQALAIREQASSVEVAGDESLGLGESWTLAVWLYPDDAEPGTLLARLDSAGTSGWSLAIVNRHRLELRVNGSTAATTYGPVGASRWQHLVLVFDAGTLTYYVDGAVWEHVSGLDRQSTPVPAGTPLRIGGFVGKLDELALWQRRLTDQEVEQLFQRQRGPWGGGRDGLVTSELIDLGKAGPARLSWRPRSPTGKAIPDAKRAEAGYPGGGLSLDDLRALWHFDDAGAVTEGTNFLDTSGGEHHAVAHSDDGSGFEQLDGVAGLGRAICLDGIDDFIEVPAAALADLRDVTFAAWLLWRGAVPPFDPDWQRIFDFGDGTLADAERGAYMFLTPAAESYEGHRAPRLSFSLAGYTYNEYVSASHPLRAERWTHVAVTVSGDTGALYLDGELAARTRVVTDPRDIRIERAWLGKSAFGPLDPNLSGCLDEVAIWGRALSSGEIAALHARAATRVSLQLRACDAPEGCAALPFVGPDGTESSHFDEPCCGQSYPPSAELPAQLRKRWVQFRLTLASGSSLITPEVAQVVIEPLP